MCPNRFKLGRARRAALNIIHGDEAEQIALLFDYGQELRKSNPGSKFFLTTNHVKEHADLVPKQHLQLCTGHMMHAREGFLKDAGH
jgi:hypothetical protein